MKRCFVFLFVFFLSMPLVLGFEEWVYQSSYLDIETEIFSSIYITPTSTKYNVEYVKADLYFFPYDDVQDVVSLTTEPEATKKDELYEFRWEKPFEDRLDFSLSSVVRTKNIVKPITKRVSFPIVDVPSEYNKYTLPSEKIDSDNVNIVNLASSIAQGKDDLYEVVFEFAKWVNMNVDYDLGTLTANAVQKASWVLKKRKGVCDEITGLFIALCRSVGIPAKYTSGVAYTNYAGFNGFGSHAWAEVYFPGYGWVSYDITYGEFGYVDGAHVKLRESVDSDEASVEFEWKGYNIDLDADELEIETKLKRSSGKVSLPIRIYSVIAKEKVGFGSYNLVSAEVSNDADYYYATKLKVTVPKEVEIKDKERHIMLKPNEKKTISWILRVDDDLDPRYSYTIPVIVYTTRNVTSQSSFKSTKKASVYGGDYFSVEEEEQKDIVFVETPEKKEAEEVIVERKETIVYDVKEEKESFFQKIIDFFRGLFS